MASAIVRNFRSLAGPLVTYLILTVIAVALIVLLALRTRRSTVSEAVLGFARSMDTTCLYAGSRRSRGMRSSGPGC
jgi:hypothetical protein